MIYNWKIFIEVGTYYIDVTLIDAKWELNVIYLTPGFKNMCMRCFTT